MILLTILFEFLKIGLFAVGGGLVTIPFLYELSEKYGWYTPEQLTDMFAMTQPLPGPMGVNLGAFAAYYTAGFPGAIMAVIGLSLPAVIIIILISKYLNKYQENIYVQRTLYGIRPAALALIAYAGLQIAKVSVFDIKTGIMFLVCLGAMHFIKKWILTCILLSGLVGILLHL